MKKIGFIFTLLFICAISCFLLWKTVLWKIFACGVAGSYECAQIWRFKTSEKRLNRNYKRVKKEHTKLEVPNYCCPTEIKHEYRYNVFFLLQTYKRRCSDLDP